MKRQLKYLARRLLPQSLVQLIKAMYARDFNRSNLPPVALAEMDGFIRCTVGDLRPFDAPFDCKSELVHYASTDEGRSEFAEIARYSRRGGLLFDIGAHTGLMSALFCAGNPANRAICIEPSPALQRRIEAMRILGNFGERLRIEPVAIGEKPGQLTMLVDPVVGFVQTQRFDHSMWGEPQELEVQVESIPSLAARLGIVPDFIKIDIEGYEYEAVQGAIAFFREHRPVLFFELHLNYLEERRLSPKHLVKMLSECGYMFRSYADRELSAHSIYDSPLANVRFICQ